MKIALPEPPAWFVDWEALDAEHTFVQRMRGVRQDPVHHAEGDVWIHTRLVCEALAGLPTFRASTAAERDLLFRGALLHDVGKPDSTRIGDDGRVTSQGHSTRGASLARRILWRGGFPFESREAVVGIVRHHQAPFWLLEREDPRSLVLRISQTTRCDHLAIVAEADARGRTCSDARRILDNIELFRSFCEEQGCLTAPFRFPSDHARFLYFGAEGARDPAYRPHESFRCEVVLLSGFPGAGKDTWIGENLPSWPVVSLDQIRRQLGVDAEDAQGAVVAKARDEAREHLRAGRSFAWNATNLSKRIRGQCIRLFADYGARVRIVYVEVPEQTLWRQNRERAAPVPENVLESLLDRWEVPDVTEAHEVTYVVRS